MEGWMITWEEMVEKARREYSITAQPSTSHRAVAFYKTPRHLFRLLSS